MALGQLLQCGMVEWRGESILDVTHNGYLVADEILSTSRGFVGPAE
jgi:hypothetical protein